METNFKHFSVCKLDAHSLANVPLIQTARVHHDGRPKLLDGGNVGE